MCIFSYFQYFPAYPDSALVENHHGPVEGHASENPKTGAHESLPRVQNAMRRNHQNNLSPLKILFSVWLQNFDT